MDNYKYKLQLTNDDSTITHEFPADITVDRLLLHLRDFLCGCSWSENILNDILRLEDEESITPKYEQIFRIYQKHKKLVGYEAPSTEALDLFILSTCVTSEYIDRWLQDMKNNPPKAYPLDKIYMPNQDVWIDIYWHNGYGNRSGIAEKSSYFIDRDFVEQQFEVTK